MRKSARALERRESRPSPNVVNQQAAKQLTNLVSFTAAPLSRDRRERAYWSGVLEDVRWFREDRSVYPELYLGALPLDDLRQLQNELRRAFDLLRPRDPTPGVRTLWVLPVATTFVGLAPVDNGFERL